MPSLHWVPVGRDRGNGGRIKLAGEPMNPLAERLVNGMEALLELARLRELAKDSNAAMPPTPREAVLRYFGFPRLDQIERLDDDERKVKSTMADKVRKDLSIKLDFEKKSKQSPSQCAITGWARRQRTCTAPSCRSAVQRRRTSRT